MIVDRAFDLNDHSFTRAEPFLAQALPKFPPVADYPPVMR